MRNQANMIKLQLMSSIIFDVFDPTNLCLFIEPR